MDEIEYAVMLACFIDLALAKEDAKLMLDGLKEWARQLESGRGASGGASAAEGPTVVQLVHAVPRPGTAPA